MLIYSNVHNPGDVLVDQGWLALLLYVGVGVTRVKANTMCTDWRVKVQIWCVYTNTADKHELQGESGGGIIR